MAENKVGYGLSKLYYAIATIDDSKHTATYGNPKAFPGAISLNLDAQGDRVIKRADNVDYWIGNANNGYEGDLEVARVSDAFLKDILGEVDDDNGVQVELKDVEAVHFALMFQFEGDKRGTRHVLYNCTASRPAQAPCWPLDCMNACGDTPPISKRRTPMPVPSTGMNGQRKCAVCTARPPKKPLKMRRYTENTIMPGTRRACAGFWKTGIRCRN